GKLLVRKGDRSGETHLHSVFGREPQPGSRFAYRRRCFASGLQISEIKHRLDVHEATKLRKLCLAAGDQLAPGERRVLSFVQELHGVCECIERRRKGFQLYFSQAHTLERLRKCAKNATQRRIGSQRSEKRLRRNQVCGGALYLV